MDNRALKPEDVRWYYKKNATEKICRPLNGRDSLLIEMAYRRHVRLLAKSETNAQTAEENWNHTAVALDGLYGLVWEEISKLFPISVSEDGESKKKFWYFLKPLYWEGNRLPLIRGTWFVDAGGGALQPLNATSPDLAAKIEEKYLELCTADSTDPNAVHEVIDSMEQQKPGFGARVRFVGISNATLFNHNKSSRLWRYLRMPSSGARLIRGYPTKATFEDGPPPTTNLVLFIHGIGQKSKRNRFVHNVDRLRVLGEEILRKHYPKVENRPMFVPIDWRTDLEVIDHIILDLTPNCLEQIRSFFNESLMDLIYYTSPIYGQTILRCVIDLLNQRYRTFVTHDPGFANREGRRISLVGHSLGAVIAHDILSLDNTESAPGLCFKADDLFCLGAPLGVFLAVRQRRGLQILQPPSANSNFRLFNVYNPADAVAYRIEPIVSPFYTGVRPLNVYPFDSANQTPYHQIPPERLPLRNLRVEPPSPSTPTSTDEDSKVEEKTKVAVETEKVLSTLKQQMKTETVEIPVGEALPYRVDFALRTGRMISAYWTAATAHNCYWGHRDVVNFMLTVFYGTPSGDAMLKAKSRKK